MKLVSICLLFLISCSVLAQETPPFANITSVDFRGTGCDAESARVSITPDLQFFSILYDRFSAEAGTGSINPANRMDTKNCAVIVNFDLPAGWSFQFEEIEYRGFVSLPNSNTSAQQLIMVETPAGRSRNFEQNILRGPMMDNFVTRYKNQIENIVQPQSIMQKTESERINPALLGRGGFFGPMGPIRGRPGGPPGLVPVRPGRPVPPPIAPPQGPPMIPPGHGGGMGRRRHIRRGDMFDCSEQVQRAQLRIRSRIMVNNQKDPSNSNVKIIVDSTDATFSQKLKINWNRCIRD